MDNDSHNHIETISGEDSADIDADIDGDDEFNDGCDLQSLNESLMDLNAMKVNASPFVVDKITRNTITVRPSYEKKTLEDHYKSNNERKTNVIYEEVEDDV